MPTREELEALLRSARARETVLGTKLRRQQALQDEAIAKLLAGDPHVDVGVWTAAITRTASELAGVVIARRDAKALLNADLEREAHNVEVVSG